MKTIRCDEEDTVVVSKEDTLLFPNVDSCTAITVAFQDGTRYGAHLVATKPDFSFTPEALKNNFAYILRQIGRDILYTGHTSKPIAKAFLIGSTLGYYTAEGKDSSAASALYEILGIPWTNVVRLNVEANPIYIHFFGNGSLIIYARGREIYNANVSTIAPNVYNV
jgi:hypothetical protein